METKYKGLPDVNLCYLVRLDNEEAFAELSDRYAGMVRGKALMFSGSQYPDREDLVQEGFMGLYSAALTFDEDRGVAFSAYAALLVYRHMLDLYRVHWNKRNRPLNEALPLDRMTEPSFRSPEALLETQEMLSALQLRIDERLTPLENRVFELFLSGHTRQEAAELAGLELKVYDNALLRAKRKLRETPSLKGTLAC